MKLKFNFKNIDFKKIDWKYWWYEWIKPIIIAAILALFIRTFIIQPFKIPSSSMYPTLRPGDRIFVSKFLYGARVPLLNLKFPEVREPKTGDIVVFLSHVEKKKYLVKRYIARGPDTIQIKDGDIYVSGNRITQAPFNKFRYYPRGEYGPSQREIKIPEGFFYVLGDNSANSLDSRYWGFVPEKNLVGKAVVIHWPLNRMKILKDGE
ncbi:signal peptidase I [Candidatus Omnitrophus magneticus]|uniref:Signal peptidase I n=1 Tax=Candidatus Omnitrophus magneticus TaxID=1609969 RepID=A0A0F0CTX6_9BACT|nr:signal peptidase I [Candidatus Omnitrophus magneticus]